MSDAVTDRVYRKAFGMVEALQIMRDGRGSHFDADMLGAFLEVLEDVVRVKDQFNDDHRSAGGSPSSGSISSIAGLVPQPVQKPA